MKQKKVVRIVAVILCALLLLPLIVTILQML